MTTFNPFRKHDSHRHLHARWGDVSISAPTEGSWSQYSNPHQPSHRKTGYGPGFVPDCSPRSQQSSDEDESTTSKDTSSSSTSSRRNSFSISTLNPRRLSMRLAPRSKTPSSDIQTDKDNRQQHQQQHYVDRRAEFAYRPIRQDYPTEVAEKTPTTTTTSSRHDHRHDRRASRFRYIPAGTRYVEELGPAPSRSQSISSRGHGHANSKHPIKHTERVYDDDDYYEESPYRDEYRNTTRSSHRDSVDSRRLHPLDAQMGGLMISNPMGRKKGSSRLTMAMVPDPEDLYE